MGGEGKSKDHTKEGKNPQIEYYKRRVQGHRGTEDGQQQADIDSRQRGGTCGNGQRRLCPKSKGIIRPTNL